MKKVLAIMLVTLIVFGAVGYVAAQHRRPLPPPPPPPGYHRGHHPPAHGGHRTNTYTYQGYYYVDGGPPNCFIATSVYGADHGATSILRNFRDKRLTDTFGRKLVAFYYEVGPTVARTLDANDFLKPIVKIAFYPVVGVCYLVN